MPRDVFDATIATDVLGNGNVARTARERFREQGGGKLVVVGSVLGTITTALMSTYGSSSTIGRSTAPVRRTGDWDEAPAAATRCRHPGRRGA